MFIELTMIEISSKEIVKREKILINPAHIQYIAVFQGDAQTGHTAIYTARDSDPQVLADEPYNTIKAKLLA